ncbi:PRD domain-containing protein [Kineothrix sp. MB12-C1]|uniref:PRD domain-containing protein n=1 Tax=Kineothrix sp. MB12-C1 TaxID=3070215 RepID=UPI0027D20CFE|nr:PRD domain-containing protein [Kineothrix sp. MB12-C1]WMC93913.1 PRD domain-containing protein [Kineothrix sp. MB12-C1]
MKIKKPLGNNAVLTEDKNGIEQVAIGNGIGFKKRAGDEVEQSKIQNLYIVKDEDTKNSDVEKAIQNIQPDNIVLASKIIKAGEKELGYRCNDSILLALADHLDFAITRAKNNTFFSTPLEWDIRVIYPKEYEFSLKAIQYISDYCKIVIPNQEAPFIALHFINSQINESNSLNDMTETILYTGIIQNILDITRYHYGFKVDQNSFEFSRFVVHIRYFVRRQLGGIEVNNNSELMEVIAEKCPFDYSCAKKIEEFLVRAYKWKISKSELLYLTLHLNRVSTIAKDSDSKNV